MCQLDLTTGCPGMWWNPVSGRDWHLHWHRVKPEALPSVGGHHSIPRRSKQNKPVQEGWILSLTVWMLSEDISPLLPSDQDSHHWFPCFLGLWTLSELDRHFPGSPACRWQTVGLLCLHNCVSQFLILYYLPPPPLHQIVSVSLENPNRERSVTHFSVGWVFLWVFPP